MKGRANEVLQNIFDGNVKDVGFTIRRGTGLNASSLTEEIVKFERAIQSGKTISVPSIY